MQARARGPEAPLRNAIWIRALLVGRAVFASEAQARTTRISRRLSQGWHNREVVIRVLCDVPGGAVTDLQQYYWIRGTIDELVRVAIPRRKPRAGTGIHCELTVVRDESRLPLQDEYEFVLLGVVVPQCGCRARLESGPIDSEVREPEDLAKRALETSGNDVGERFGVHILTSTGPRLRCYREWSRSFVAHELEPTICDRLLRVWIGRQPS